MKVLVVDDDAMAGEMTAAVLEDAGHSVLLAENGMDAVEKIDANDPFDMIVSDMNMPLISGIDLFRMLRDQNVDTPFILLTGDAPAPLKEEEPRLDDCVMKDFNLDTTLIQAMDGVQQRRRV